MHPETLQLGCSDLLPETRAKIDLGRVLLKQPFFQSQFDIADLLSTAPSQAGTSMGSSPPLVPEPRFHCWCPGWSTHKFMLHVDRFGNPMVNSIVTTKWSMADDRVECVAKHHLHDLPRVRAIKHIESG
jgi:hypothetical protein